MTELRTTESFPVLLTPPSFEEDWELGLPVGEDNIFARIIRDPTNPDRPMRERRCAELLCGLLRSVPAFQDLFVHWLCEAAGGPPKALAGLKWDSRTEYGIDGQKRIDLLLEGTDEDSGKTCILWAVEIKVGAGFHYGRRHRSVTEDDENGEPDVDFTAAEVNQLVNYDDWLAEQSADHRSGFVLAVQDMARELPGLNLRQPWHCLTWGQLGQQITQAIQDDAFGAADLPFIRHYLGFINHFLRDSAMLEGRLDFNAMAFLKAYLVYGAECEKMIDNMVAPIEDIFRSSRIKFLNIRHRKVLYGKDQGSIVKGTLYRNDKTRIYLYAGFDRDWCVYLQTIPPFPQKTLFRKELDALTTLQAGEYKWSFPDINDWEEIQMVMPMTKLLHVDDQAQTVQDFAKKAIADLEQINLNAIIEKVTKGA